MEIRIDESRVRDLASEHGYTLRKSRAQKIHMDDFGEYMLIDHDNNFVILGARFDATLPEISEYLNGRWKLGPVAKAAGLFYWMVVSKERKASFVRPEPKIA